MKKYIFSILSVATAAMIVLSACKKEKNPVTKPEDNFDRQAMLTSYADNLIIPAYTSMSKRMDECVTAVNAFATNPTNETLVNARAAWRTAYIEWEKVDLLEFGPAEDISLRMYTNVYPTTVSKIENNINAGTYDLEEFGNKDAQGFPAMDYLLNGVAGNDADILKYYTEGAQNAQRRQYLKDVATKMQEKINKVKSDWSGTYRNTYISSTGTDAGSSLSKTVNAYVLYFERYLRSGKIGLPAGAMTGVAKPELAEAYYTADNLRDELARTAMKSVQDFYNNTGGTSSLKSYLAAIGTKDDNGKLIADVINEEMNEAVSALGNTDIKKEVTQDRQKVLLTYQQLQDVVPLLKVDMVSALGISITYVDNDGD
jgi:predicted lipoprotein